MAEGGNGHFDEKVVGFEGFGSGDRADLVGFFDWKVVRRAFVEIDFGRIGKGGVHSTIWQASIELGMSSMPMMMR